MFVKEQKQPDGSLILFPKSEHKYSLIWMHGLGILLMDSQACFKNNKLSTQKPKYFYCKHLKDELLQIKAMLVRVGLILRYRNQILKNSDLEYFKTTVSIDEIEESKMIINKYLNEEVAKVQAKNVFIGGFSQGCCMALEVGLSYSQKLGGIIGLSGDLFTSTKLQEIQDQTPLLIIHGKDDSVVPCDFYHEVLKD